MVLTVRTAILRRSASVRMQTASTIGPSTESGLLTRPAIRSRPSDLMVRTALQVHKALRARPVLMRLFRSSRSRKATGIYRLTVARHGIISARLPAIKVSRAHKAIKVSRETREKPERRVRPEILCSRALIHLMRTMWW